MGCGRKSYLGPAEIASFSSRDFSRSSKHGIFWHAPSTGYFYVLLLCFRFLSLGNLQKLRLSLRLSVSQSTATQITTSTNRFTCSKYYPVWNQFLIKINVKVLIKDFYIQIWFKFVFTFTFIFTKKQWSTEKRTLEKNSFFAVEYVKTIELYIVHIWRRMQSE